MALFDYSGGYLVSKSLKGRDTTVTPWNKRGTTFFKNDPVYITPWDRRGETNFPSTFPMNGLGEVPSATQDGKIRFRNGVEIPLAVVVDHRTSATQKYIIVTSKTNK